MFQPSAAGIKFSGDHEGFVSRTYKDPGGVLTIGRGFTNLSPVCRAWFINRWGHQLRMGDSMTSAEADELMRLVMEKETVPVANGLLPDSQEAFDAENDVIYNCGPGAANWQWAILAKAQKYADAAIKLLTTAVTASGKPSAGLKRRRADEAMLLQHGSYASTTNDTAITTDPAGVRNVQSNLGKLHYYNGPLDGNYRSDAYIKAVKNFQRAYGLTVDGRVGKATRSALQRAVAALAAPNFTIASGSGLTGSGWLASKLSGLHLDNPWVIVGCAVGALVVAYLAFLVWHNRGLILRKRTTA